MVPLQYRGFVRAPQALVHIEGSARSQLKLIASFKMKSEELGRTRGHCLENREIVLNMQVAAKQINLWHCLAKSWNSKSRISFEVTQLTALKWPYSAHNIPGNPSI